MKHKTDLLGTFAHHKVAANLLMIIMIIGGIFALDKLNIQFFPNFELDFISVRVTWRGASAEDVEKSITIPLEQSLKTIDNLRHITSTSSIGSSSISIELEEGSDNVIAINQVKQKIDEFRNLPADAEEPEVANVIRYEPVARLLLTGTSDVTELRHLVNSFERELLQRGIDKIDIAGLPDEEMAIEISNDELQHLQIGLDQIGQRIDQLSRDIPAGTFGELENSRELRSLDQRRDELGFANLPVISENLERVNLGTIATINRQAEKGSVTLSVGAKPAVEMVIRRAESGDSFEAAQILEKWLQDTRQQLPPGIELLVYNESWQLIRDRITLLLRNGASGLILVVAILYLFLTPRVAGWVAVGIPVSFMATMFVLYLAGGSINMLSLFGLIMALGIIVDDAIVVGEDALTHYQAGEEPLLAAEGGARRMLAPVIASSLTTIAAFLPLMLVSGPTGKILFGIPLVIISVIFASVIESFYVLPGHLRHSFLTMHNAPSTGWRARFDQSFERFTNYHFRRFVQLALKYRGLTLSIVVSMLIATMGLLAGGRIQFNFFPSPESTLIYLNASFLPGTPKTNVDKFLTHLERTLEETDFELSQQTLVTTAVSRHGIGISNKGRNQHKGDHLGAMTIELLPSDQREVRNNRFIEKWKEKINLPSGLDNLTITERAVGPPGRQLSIRLTGHDSNLLKNAALALAEAVKTVPGVSNIEDDMPFGREQLVYKLTPTGEALGLSTADLGRQLRTAFEGRLIQLFQDGPNEVEVRIKLPASEREHLGVLNKLNIRLDSGSAVPLSTVAEWRSDRGFEILRHAEGQLAVEISADVDNSVNNPGRILENLETNSLPDLVNRYGISYSFEGQSAEQTQTLDDMKRGLMLGLALIYLILAGVFASYGRPIIVMAVIPLGLIGALVGHLIMGIDMTILSMFGFFGLAGIVVNDSIILVTFYQHIKDQGLSTEGALAEASCQRLRAVLLTSLTTIAGLTPLLFETSQQAQFLIPMATSIAFGLAFATLLVLIVVPALLFYYEDFQYRLKTGSSIAKTSKVV